MKNNETKHRTLRVFFFRMVFHLLLRKFLILPDKMCFQKSEDILQEKSKCSTDSVTSRQKVQLGESTKPIQLSLSFVKTMQFRILY